MSALFALALRILLAASLYAFLGWALWTLWGELHAKGTSLAGRKIPGIHLAFQPKNKPLVQRYFVQSEILLGRDLHCDFPLPDDTVSVRHARLSYHHGQWWLEDLGSTNKTRLNDEDLTIPTVVISGDEIQCGKTSLIINLGDNPTNPPTQRIPDSGDFE